MKSNDIDKQDYKFIKYSGYPDINLLLHHSTISDTIEFQINEVFDSLWRTVDYYGYY